MGEIGGLRFSYWNVMKAAEGLRKTRLTVDKQRRALLGVDARLCCLRLFCFIGMIQRRPPGMFTAHAL
jgi:hypothetical protein